MLNTSIYNALHEYNFYKHTSDTVTSTSAIQNT